MRYPCLLPLVLLLVVPSLAATNAVPFVNLPLVPSTTVPGTSSFTMIVNGTGFVPGAVVNWNGVPLATRFVNPNQLKAYVTGSDVGLPGTSMVSVTNPGPGGGTSNAAPFTATLPTNSLTFNSSTLTVGTAVSAITAADFNKDGRVDLAVANMGAEYTCGDIAETGLVTIFVGSGQGSFHPGENVEVGCDTLGSQALSEAVGDFNHDGHLDLAFTMSRGGGGPVVSVHLGNGATFANQPSFTQCCWDTLGANVAVGDFDRDGELDFAVPVSTFGIGEILAFLGDGNGTFSRQVESYSELSGDVTGAWLAVGDFNRDGILDVVTTNPIAGLPAVVLLGNGDGTFSPAQTQPATTLVSPQFVTVGDFNGDGILDLAFADSGSTTLTVLLGKGDGTFTQKSGEPDAGQTTTYITTADFNGDGKLDLALITSNNSVLIYLGNGDGTFETPLEVGAGNGASQLAVGDFKGDGRLDLAVVNSGDNTVSLLLQSPAAVLSSSSITYAAQEVGTLSPAQRVTLTNSGSARLNIQSMITSGDFSEATNCGSIETIGHACQISVYFKPTETGLRTGSVVITDDAGDSPQTITLSGTGK
jgi:hypothetical protein